MSTDKSFNKFSKEIIKYKRQQQNKRDKAIEIEYGPGNQPPNKNFCIN